MTEATKVANEKPAVNKVVCKAIFLSAQESEKKKVGVTILLIDSMDEKGQVRVSLEQKVSGKQTYTVSPVIQNWFDPDPAKTDPAVFKRVYSLLTEGGLKTVYAIISGNGDFRKIHKFLSKEEYETYLSLVQ